MASQERLEELQQHIQCCICRSTLEDPRFLSCHHVYCKKCLERLVLSTSPPRVLCPDCCKETQLPSDGVNGLPVSSLVEKLKDSLAKLHSQPGHSLSPKPCDLHPSETRSLYCISCQESTCPNCIIYDGKHSKPPCDNRNIKNVAAASRATLLKSLDLSHRKVAVQQSSDCIKKLRQTLEEHHKTSELKINKYYDKLLQVLQTRREQAIQALHEGRDAHVQEIEAWQKETDHLLSQMYTMQARVEGLEDEEILLQEQSLLSEIANIRLKAIPVDDLQFAEPYELPIDKVMSQLGCELMAYKVVDPTRCKVKLERDVKVNTTACVYVTLCDSTGLPCSIQQNVTVKLTSPSGDGVTSNATPLSSSRYLAHYKLTLHTRGHCQLIVDIDGQHVHKEPIVVQCLPQQLQGHNGIHVIEHIKERGCLKVIDKHVFCVTRSDSGKPCAIYIEDGDVRIAFYLLLPTGLGISRWTPDEIAVSKKFNSLYISDLHNHKVHQFTLDEGKHVALTGNHGSKLGQFNRPNGLCVAQDGSLYVCDSDNHRIQVFKQNLTFSRTFGTLGTGCSELNWPSNVAIDSDGNIYVTDLNNHRIQCFTSSGEHIRFIGSGPGKPPCNISRPNIMHIHGPYIFVSDDRGVVVFTSNGKYVTRFATDCGHPIEGLTVCSDGFVYVYDCSRNTIVVY